MSISTWVGQVGRYVRRPAQSPRALPCQCCRLKPSSHHCSQPVRPPSDPSLTQQLGLDDYGTIRVINFIRTEVAAGRDPRPALSAAAAAGSSSAANEAAAAAAPWSGDTYLQPVLADDPLLTYDFDDEQQQQQDGLAAAMGGLRWVVVSLHV